MPDEIPAAPANEQQLDDVLAQYIASEEAGRLLDRQELLVRHPQFAADLREFFANCDQMQRLAEPLRGNADPGRARGPLGKLRYFGDYELLEEVAAGGMGIVYKARQISLNRIVAVKMILKGTLASEEDVKRFQAEAEAAASLQHPAIVAIHEVGLHEGQHYFSMDFVEGHSLGRLQRLVRRRLHDGRNSSTNSFSRLYQPAQTCGDSPLTSRTARSAPDCSSNCTISIDANAAAR